MAKMTEEGLLGTLQHELGSSVTWAMEHLQDDQLKGLQYYLGMPLGNEIKGRSQIVSWDVFEVIESAMPGFIEPFFSSDNIGQFEPRGPEDEAYSDQATDYCNYIVKQRNQGFLLFMTWIKDALLSKVGVVRGEWEDAEPKRREFKGLTDEQMVLIAQDDRIEVIEHAQYPVPGMPPLNEAQQIMLAGQAQVPMLHDVTLLQKQAGCVKIENVRPENFILTSGIGTLEKARVIGEWVVYTRSELKQMGIRQHADVSSYDQAIAATDGLIEAVREESAIGNELALDDNFADKTLEEVKLFKGFLRADFNGDGIAEWRRVLVGGGEDPILENEEADSHNYCVISPILIPHRVIGMSYADAARPIHELKTVLTRQYLDSLYQANRPRTYVNLDAQVSIDDLLSDRIGGIIRGKGPANTAVQPMQTTLVSRDALEGLQLADGMRETRLGIPKFNPGLEADALHKTATGVRSINNLVDKRQKLVLRTMAETGVRDLFRLVLKLVTEYQDVAAMVRLRGEFVPFDPRGWNPDMDVTIDLGAGTSDETETMMMLQQFGQYMAWAAPYGVVRPQNVYEFGKMLAKNSRLKGADQRLLTDPTANPPPPAPPDPKMALAQAEMANDAHKFQAEQAARQQEQRFDAWLQQQTDQNRQEMEARQKTLELRQAAELEAMRQEAADRAQQRDLEFKQWQVTFQAEQARNLELMRQAAQAPAPVDLSPLMERIDLLTRYVMAKPSIQRDPQTGRAVAIEKGGVSMPLERDPNGRVIGLADVAAPMN